MRILSRPRVPGLNALRSCGTEWDVTARLTHLYLKTPSIVSLSVISFTFIISLDAHQNLRDMVALFLTYFLALDFSLLSLAQGGPEPLQIPASDRLYGPDGPWQAVSVQLGTPPQDLDLFPGGVYQSSVFTNQLCQDITSTPCGSGGLFDPNSSSSIDNTSISYEDTSTKLPSGWTDGAMLLSYSTGVSILDTLQIAGQTVVNFDVAMYPEISMVYPDGSYPLQIGALSLGPTVNQSFSETPPKMSAVMGSSFKSDNSLGLNQSIPMSTYTPPINASLVPGYLVSQNVIPSNSFGLHVGIAAAALKLGLSLWFGGYDASRIAGPVSSQSIQDDAASEFAIDLLDIGIGVENGGSPFSFSSQYGLLSVGNSSISKEEGLRILMNPAAPYLYLPSSTCAAIAKVLPVTYNAGKALYFWDVTDAQFARIVESPTFLSFIFRGSDGNLTINVPFSLLNLTLQEPLVSTPTPYFPCQPPQAPDISTTYYSLGRAFLQAAFIGVNWDGSQGFGEWYLAQAPGPNTDNNPQSKPFTNGSPPVGLNTDWAGTWKGFWTALPTPVSLSTSRGPSPTNTTVPTQRNTASVPSKHGMSGGAIAGTTIGAGAIALAATGFSILLFRRRRGRHPQTPRHSWEHKDQTHIPLTPPRRYWERAGGSENGEHQDQMHVPLAQPQQWERAGGSAEEEATESAASELPVS